MKKMTCSLAVALTSFTFFMASSAKADDQCGMVFEDTNFPAHEKAPAQPVKKVEKIKAGAKAPLADGEMADIFKMLNALGHGDSSDVNATVMAERHSLLEFLSQDSSKNLAVVAPFNVMNAAQRMLAIIMSQGVKRVRLPLSGEEVNLYPFFTSGSEITGGTRIIGAERAIEKFVANLEAQARGDRSGASIALLVGPPGTGKSETLKLLGKGAETLTSQMESKFAAYTFAWTNLAEIPSLHKFIPSTKGEEGKTILSDVDAPLGDSPFTLFPEGIQNLILEKASKQAEALIDGMVPSPQRTADPISAFLREEIIQHYSEIRGHVLTPAEIVEVLNKHVIVKRQVLGQSYGTMPLIDAQGNDLDIAGLIMTPNPVVRFATGVGPTHVMAWYLNGKILKGHGNAVLFDEFFRSPAEFRNLLLSAFESRVLTVGGAPSVKFDSAMIAATNSQNLAAAMAEDSTSSTEGGRPGISAAANRFTYTPMRWSVQPNEVAQLLLSGKQSELFQQALDVEDAPIVRGNIDELLPRIDSLARKAETPDGRYRLWFGEGSKRVDVAPHAMMLMAEILAATRMELDPNRARTVSKGKIVTSNLLRNPIDRLRLYEGLKPDVQASEIRELYEVGMLLKEGEAGISARDAARWLSQAIEAARNTPGKTLTPGIALKTFRNMVNETPIAPNNKTRMEWLELATEISSQILIPRLESDISTALASGDGVVKSGYFDLIDEMFSIHQDESARTYTSSVTGQERTIDYERLAKVREIYKKKNGRELNISQIAIFHAQQAGAGKVGRVPDESLLDAISTYYASIATQMASLNSLVEYEKTGTASDEVRASHSVLVESLKKMGYNDVAIRDALMLANDRRNLRQADQDNSQN